MTNLSDFPKQTFVRSFDIDAISIPIVYNRYGRHDPQGRFFVLKEDIDRFSGYAIAYKNGDVRYVIKKLIIAKLPKPAPEPEKKPVVVYYPVITGGNVFADKASAAAGQTVSVKASFGYDIVVTDAGGRRIATFTEKGSFTMPASKFYVTAVRNEVLSLMSTGWRHSYVYFYDADMNKLKVSSDSKRGIIVIDLSADHAGCGFTIYSGRKSTKTKITSGTLDKNGKITFNAEEGKNYTLIVEC